ncbi:MAG TPA: tripartite tricarboxylate transporter substrate binding protein [Vineibacter sp.]|nr:tripartite tricarboxylate transporter substrate binding protein [Vineibacter sp.]
MGSVMTRRGALALTAGAALAQTAVGRARAQTYPGGPIRIVVPFAAGSATDTGARHISEGLNKLWGVPAVVENKAGGNGAIAAEIVARAKPDGQTLFVTSNTAVASNVAMFKSLSYDPLKDFEPLTAIGSAPTFLMIHPSLPVTDVKGLVALAKQQPGKLNFASGSASTRISGEMLKWKTGIDIVHVPYKSTPLGLQDLVAGHVQIMFTDPVTGLPQVKAGTVRCLGTSSRQRYRLTPDIPTMIEQGLEGFELGSWTAVYAPAGLPVAVRDKLHAALVQIISDPAYVKRQAESGSEISPTSPDDLRRIQLAEIQIYRDIMKAAGIEPE